ncbi:hypothetical protein [Streptomyces buecherae]|uniref:FtsK domain-containing protein n=1 Tax=Streptomyces buecherae TaxID=2763006 RepID=A0A7H8NKE2_9ACTN|nr:hypothetical protein [Streptomyces buecherae]QKW55044.1 hypothetical protein HUT08_36555 [Streptomyces buecherae]
MSTTDDHTLAGREVEPYEGEFVWAELVDDDDPGPRTDPPTPDPTPGPHARQAARHIARCAATVARTIAGRLLVGGRHGLAALRHWAAVAYMSDDEIRRRLIKKHLDRHIEDREHATHRVSRLSKQFSKLASTAADYGLDAGERKRLRDTARELDRRRAGLKALEKIGFEATQPSAEQIRRARSLRALGHVAGVLVPATAAAAALTLTAPTTGLVLLPLAATGAWWLAHHPLTLTTRPVPADLLVSELAPPATAATDTHTENVDVSDPEEVTQLAAALAAAGLLALDKRRLEVIAGPDHGDNGHTLTVDLPKGGGKLVTDVLKRLDVVAGDLGVPQTQLVIREVPAAEGGHGRRMHVWVADQDPYLAVGHAPSPLATAEAWDFWAGTPFGQTVMAERRTLPTEFGGGFTSHFYSGIMRFGKTGAMRLDVAAALLDVGVRLYLANGKAGADWRPATTVAHRFTEGTDESGLAEFEALLDELTDDMTARYRTLGTLDTHLVPEGRLTPDLARHHDMPVLLAVIDELQLYLLALPPKRRERALEKLKNLLRAGPAAGVFLTVGTQRPDGEEVPTGFRDLFGVRVSVRCLDSRSSRMSLGDLASDAGADASVLTEDHVAVAVVAVGHRWEIVSVDWLSIEEFATVCARARALREQAGTLTGDAAGQYRVTEPREIRALRACLDALDTLGTDRARIETLAETIGTEGEFEDITKAELGDLLRKAGCGKVVSIGAVDGQKNASGYKRTALETALEAAA